MLKAFLKLGLLTAAFLSLTVFAVFFVRWLGFQMVFAPPPHPWFAQDFWYVYSAPPEVVCTGKPVASNVPKNEWLVSIPVKRLDNDWVIPCEKPLPLAEFLKKETHPNLILHVQATDTWDLDKLVATVSPYEKDKKFALYTDSQKVAMFLRKKAPQWLFAADPSSLARMTVFESLWIETAMDFWPDFVISSLAPDAQLKIDERLAREFERRKKRVVWNMEQNAHTAPRIPYQGIMTNRPSEALPPINK